MGVMRMIAMGLRRRLEDWRSLPRCLGCGSEMSSFVLEVPVMCLEILLS